MRYDIIMLVLSLWLMPLASSWADCTCTEPLKPELPSGKAAAKEMETVGKEVDAYAKKMKVYRECLVKCVNSADNDLSAVVTGWNYAVETYNAGKK